MALTIADREISTMCLIDDDSSVRDSYLLNIEDLNLEAQSIKGPIDDLDSFIRDHTAISQAAICDQNLTVGGYSKFDGAEIVVRWYKDRFPVILCTKYEQEIAIKLRKFREFIPALLDPDELNPDSIQKSLEVCINEFRGKILPSREMWNALVRIENIDRETNTLNPDLNVVIPSWRPQKGIRLMLRDLPEAIRSQVREGTRLSARVNIGAERHEDLFFKEWKVIKA